ncbi:hypothetical protein EXIGLDRAFT_364293 [Exidia glandulosa HHB12029]|uniref:Uncharacterized protein n=1 Tax=Exidia glandulosa HHB12029 TaxID=1314781 RepID=A0A165C459_EXIGL|nr:hypothetical protein EXIGLDRAFT_364293 [Exidia glandulosa HHB12029]
MSGTSNCTTDDGRAQTFAGMQFLFSSVIPPDVRPEESPAQEFGVTCHNDVSPRLTARRPRSILRARDIVWMQWFLDSTPHRTGRPAVPCRRGGGPQVSREVSSASAPAEESHSTTPRKRTKRLR